MMRKKVYANEKEARPTVVDYDHSKRNTMDVRQSLVSRACEKVMMTTMRVS